MVNELGLLLVALFLIGLIQSQFRLAKMEQKLAEGGAIGCAFLVLVGALSAYGEFNSSGNNTGWLGLFLGAPCLCFSVATLWVHEAGHGFFHICNAGLTLGVMGGTLFQTLIPGGLAFYSIERGYFYSSTVFLFWLGFSFARMGPYIADARAI